MPTITELGTERPKTDGEMTYLEKKNIGESDNFDRTTKELERYLGKTYSDSCQTAIMTETAANLPDPEMHTITELGTERPKTDGDMTYLEKKNIDEAICQKLRKKDVYESDMHKI